MTLPLVHTLDPETGIRNVGMYRLQLFDARTTGMHRTCTRPEPVITKVTGVPGGECPCR